MKLVVIGEVFEHERQLRQKIVQVELAVEVVGIGAEGADEIDESVAPAVILAPALWIGQLVLVEIHGDGRIGQAIAREGAENGEVNHAGGED